MNMCVRKSVSLPLEFIDRVQPRLRDQQRTFSNYLQNLIRIDLEKDQSANPPQENCSRPGCPQAAGENSEVK